MADMAKVEGIEQAIAKFKALANKVRNEVDDASVAVGYTAGYAVYVHEDLSALHGSAFNAAYAAKIAEVKKLKRQKKQTGHSPWHTRGTNQQAKFLEQPIRTPRIILAMKQIFTRSIKVGQSFVLALFQSGLYLQRESQKIVPVDIGNLKGSAFTEIE